MEAGVNSKEIQDQMNSLFSSILIEQQKINSVKGPTDKNVQKSLLEAFEKDRGNKFFYNYLSNGKGHGPFTELVDGSIKYDLNCSMGVNLLGHSHPLLIKAHLKAATYDSLMCGNLLPHGPVKTLTEELIKSVAGSNLSHFWFATSGSFANDNALKIVWQKTDPKYKIIAFDNAFAGRTIATQNITHNPDYSQGMPKYLEVEHIPFYPKDPIEHLEKIWAKDKDSLSAIMMELIQGEAGFNFANKEYYKSICKWGKEKGLYIIIDEVQTFARTRKLFAFQMFELEKYVDVVTVGKVLQSAGTFYTKELNPKPGLIAGTWNGPLVGISVGTDILRYLREGNFYGDDGRIARLEKTFLEGLSKIGKGKLLNISGIGTMISFQIGDGSDELATKFLKNLFERGVICYKGGKKPTRIRFLIPLSLTEGHIKEIFSLIEETLKEIEC
jgi:4-aminobutyrate aminotransferase-like enzyme